MLSFPFFFHKTIVKHIIIVQTKLSLLFCGIFSPPCLFCRIVWFIKQKWQKSQTRCDLHHCVQSHCVFQQHFSILKILYRFLKSCVSTFFHTQFFIILCIPAFPLPLSSNQSIHRYLLNEKENIRQFTADILFLCVQKSVSNYIIGIRSWQLFNYHRFL